MRLITPVPRPFVILFLLLAAMIPIQRPDALARVQELPEPPDVTADAAFVRDVSANVDLYDLNGDERLAAGSTIKIVTAMVVREVVDLDAQVEIVESDPVEEGYSTMDLLVGDTLTIEQLLMGLLIPSGGDAAQALARFTGADLLGDDPSTVDPERATNRFVEEMNTLADELELENTRFVNPDGRDAEEQYTSARDLTTLAASFMEDDVLRGIVAMPSYEFVSVAGNTYTKANTNELLSDPDVIGVKTGSEVQAGACLILARVFGANEVITVVLGSDLAYDEETSEKTVDRRFDDARAIHDSLNEDYRWVAVESAEAVPGLEAALFAWQVTMPGGPELVVPSETIDDITFRIRLRKPGEAEEEVGRVLFFAGSTQVGDRPLFQAAAA